jgi:Protein of unknown function (DUF1553)/Protein of unknown function (DUF1549)/Planctomycete cytochrome C
MPPRLSSTLLVLATATAQGGQPVEFNRDIRPIFGKHCSACHGGVKEAGGISFISREGVMAAAKSGNHAIVPGNPGASELLKRIRSADLNEAMPPPKHGPPLTAAQVGMIEEWIQQGARWQEHWSHVPPKDPPVPQVSNDSWPTLPLDRFVLARLDKEKLKPSPEAPPAEWLRRVLLDLTGIPPSPEELVVFLTDSATDARAARERVVGRLLDSPRFGERWASVWLDLARYSDTYGFEKDPHRDIWPFRDWVIRAFNRDMPFDQFTIEQLAGDLLPDATADQRLATAFHRNTQTNTEGGTDDEEFRMAAVIDRVNTTWTTWQATTFGCVQCHSHPYDPIEHREFYQFTAFFDRSMDCDQDDDFPRMKVADDPAKRDETAALEERVRSLREQLNAAGKPVAAATTDWTPFVPDAFAPTHGKLAAAPDGVVASEGTLPRGNTHVVSGPARAFTALRLRILPDKDDPEKWPERGAVATHFSITLIDAAEKATPVVMKEVFADRLDGPLDPHAGGNVGAFPKLDGPRWFVFVPAVPVVPGDGMRLAVSMKQDAQTAGEQATPIRKFALDLTSHAGWSELAADPARADLWKSLGEARDALKAIPGPMVPVMVERPAGAERETRVFARGNRLSKEDVVSPGIPAVFKHGVKTKFANRLDMARWIVSAENPLTARVWVNRVWAEVFGSGIVTTLEDFGTSGESPSHPELLDHLALRMMRDHHWSLKTLLREIVLSSSYRQSHRTTPGLLAADPANRLLARGPRVRLTAEMVRDQALAAGGLLSGKMFGPPVYPPQPAGVWNSVYSGASWKDSTGEDRYRRGIYTYSKRTSGFPGFLTFDAPSRDLCSPRRISSNTPLQALVTLNDPAHIEAAQGLAKRMEAHAPDLRARLAFGVLIATQQVADVGTLDALAGLHADSSADYQTHPGESAKLAATPDAAALVLVANTILNLDSALNR